MKGFLKKILKKEVMDDDNVWVEFIWVIPFIILIAFFIWSAIIRDKTKETEEFIKEQEEIKQRAELYVKIKLSNSPAYQEIIKNLDEIVLRNYNEECIPRFPYTFKEGTTENLKLATEEAIEMWETALNDPALFIYNSNSINVIGYGETLTDTWGTTEIWEYETGLIARFNTNIHYEVMNEDYNVLLHLMLHELGWALGLDPTNNPQSVMSQGWDISPRLIEEDVENALKNFKECQEKEELRIK